MILPFVPGVGLSYLSQETRRKSAVKFASTNKIQKVANIIIKLWLTFVPTKITAEFEDLEEYSCKHFATRKEKILLTAEGEGPLVRNEYIL